MNNSLYIFGINKNRVDRVNNPFSGVKDEGLSRIEVIEYSKK